MAKQYELFEEMNNGGLPNEQVSELEAMVDERNLPADLAERFKSLARALPNQTLKDVPLVDKYLSSYDGRDRLEIAKQRLFDMCGIDTVGMKPKQVYGIYFSKIEPNNQYKKD